MVTRGTYPSVFQVMRFVSKSEKYSPPLGQIRVKDFFSFIFSSTMEYAPVTSCPKSDRYSAYSFPVYGAVNRTSIEKGEASTFNTVTDELSIIFRHALDDPYGKML
jgi:hypothetical protein